MAKDPAVLFYTQDFLVGTYGYSHEEVGKYIILLCLQHQNKDKLSEQQIMTILGSKDHVVWSKFEQDEDGSYYNERMRHEARKRRKYSRSRSKNRKKSSKKKDMKKTSKTYDKHMEQHMENEDENENATTSEKENATKIKEIVSDLNNVMDSSYKHSTSKTRKMLKARLKEGFDVEDFKIVHRKMLRKWGSDEKMCRFLRPITLYSNKFESYREMKEPNTKLTQKGVQAYHVGQAWLKKKAEQENE